MTDYNERKARAHSLHEDLRSRYGLKQRCERKVVPKEEVRAIATNSGTASEDFDWYLGYLIWMGRLKEHNVYCILI